MGSGPSQFFLDVANALGVRLLLRIALGLRCNWNCEIYFLGELTSLEVQKH